MSLFATKTWIITCFCLLAAIRVAFYSAAFPFFNNVDEEAHFDLVMKYYEEHVPTSLENFSPSSAKSIAQYGSPEFFYRTFDFKDNKLPAPLRESSPEEAKKIFDEKKNYWSSVTNHEATAAPLYYLATAAWVKLGRVFHFCKEGKISFLYWIRFFNIILIVLLVVLSYKICLILSPFNNTLLFGVPLFIAVFPQDIFYSIQSDVLSPVCYSFAFLQLLKFLNNEAPSNHSTFYVGLSIALTALVKTANLALLLLVIMVVIYKCFRLHQSKEILRILLFFVCGLAPILLWFCYNLIYVGDLTASDSKIYILGWTQKKFSLWFNNPLFTIAGFKEFYSELIASFWRGEFVWSRERLANSTADLFYILSSLLFPIITLFYFLFKKREKERSNYLIVLFSVFTSFLFIVYLSISLDFEDSPYPSREHPFFTSGRLMSAVIVPFMIVYIKGFQICFLWIKNEKITLSLLLLVAVYISFNEFRLNEIAFSSHYNFFHARSF